MKKTIMLIMVMLPLSVFAYDVELDGVYYGVSSNYAYVTYKTSNPYGSSYSGDVTIPETIHYNGKEYPVKSIGPDAFRDCKSLGKVTLPPSITGIGYSAFNSSSLKEINIPEGVTTISEYAFQGTKLKSIIIPESVTSIKASAFSGCLSLKSLTITTPLTTLGSFAFSQVGKKTDPCIVYAPEDYDFKGACFYDEYFEWNTGYFLKAKDSMPLSITSAGVATYCSLYDLDFTNVTDVKAYIIAGYDKANQSVFAMRVYDVPHRTGIYLVGPKGDYNIPTTTSNCFYTNMLVGTTVSITLKPTDGDYTNFILYGTSPADACFRPTTGGPLKGNRAYLQIPTAMLSSNANSLNIVFDDETDGINEVAAASEKNAWYTLDGRKLNGAPVQKGIYINGGRKVMVK